MDLEGVEEAFESASKFMRVTNVKLDNNQKLKLYGLFKQTTEGDCHTSKPSILDMTGRAKWTAWNGLKALSQEDAKHQYVDFVTELVPNWQEREISAGAEGGGGGGVSSPFGAPSVSVMVCEGGDAASKTDSEKTIMELVAGGSVQVVRQRLDASRSEVAVVDAQGMSALHWACDRGNEQLVELFLDYGADVNAQDADGQTPLHYAISCDHVKLVPLLVGRGADASIKDGNGESATSGADSNEMQAAVASLGIV